LGSFVFDFVADSQTNKQTDLKVIPTPTNRVGVVDEFLRLGEMKAGLKQK